jgi:hypothetical protein
MSAGTTRLGPARGAPPSRKIGTPAAPRSAATGPPGPGSLPRSLHRPSQVPSQGFLRVLSQAPLENHATNLGPPIGSPRILGLKPADSGGARIPAGDRSRVGLVSVLQRALQAETKVDALIAAVARGRTFSAGELIALQATVFRYSQTVEVISRAADRLVGAVKQTLGTQV